MTDSDWTAFHGRCKRKKEIVAEAFFMPVKDIKRDENVNLPDDIGVVNLDES